MFLTFSFDLDVRDNADRFLESLERFDNIRHEVNVGSLNNFIQGILNTDHNEVEEVVAVDTSSTGQQSTTPTIITTTRTSPTFVSSQHPLLADSFSESSTPTPAKSPPVVPYTQTPDITSMIINEKSPIVTGSQSDFSIISQFPQTLLDDLSGKTTTTKNSAKIATSTFKRSKGRPRKFSNKYSDQLVSIKSDHRSQKNVFDFKTSRITGKSTNSSKIYYSDTSNSFSSRSDSVDTYSSEDDAHLEKVMVRFFFFFSTLSNFFIRIIY